MILCQEHRFLDAENWEPDFLDDLGWGLLDERTEHVRKLGEREREGKRARREPKLESDGGGRAVVNCCQHALAGI